MVAEYAARWIGYLEHETPQLLGVYTANAGKGGYTIFARLIAQAYPLRSYARLPWCAVYVHACYLAALGKREAARRLGKPHPGSRVLARRMRRRHRWREPSYRPAPDDLIFLRTAPGARIGHCGIVERVEGETVYSIEGNTVDPGGTFPPHQGGAVARRARQLTDPMIAGYGDMRRD